MMTFFIDYVTLTDEEIVVLSRQFMDQRKASSLPFTPYQEMIVARSIAIDLISCKDHSEAAEYLDAASYLCQQITEL